MSHKIACSLCPHNLPEGRGVTLVRRYVVFNFCWHCYRTRRAECEQFMDAQSAIPKTSKNRQLQRAASVVVMLFVAALILRHCVVTSERTGFVACDCLKPLLVWDTQMRRKVYYCAGKTQ